MRTFFGLVGLGMFLGFGALFVNNWQDGPEGLFLMPPFALMGLAPLISQAPLLANGVDVGNLVVKFAHPLTGEAVERVIGAQESRPAFVDGYLFVTWGDQPNALMIISQDFTPFDLTPSEQRESTRRLLRWVATKPRRANSA